MEGFFEEVAFQVSLKMIKGPVSHRGNYPFQLEAHMSWEALGRIWRGRQEREGAGLCGLLQGQDWASGSWGSY